MPASNGHPSAGRRRTRPSSSAPARPGCRRPCTEHLVGRKERSLPWRPRGEDVPPEELRPVTGVQKSENRRGDIDLAGEPVDALRPHMRRGVDHHRISYLFTGSAVSPRCPRNDPRRSRRAFRGTTPPWPPVRGSVRWRSRRTLSRPRVRCGTDVDLPFRVGERAVVRGGHHHAEEGASGGVGFSRLADRPGEEVLVADPQTFANEISSFAKSVRSTMSKPLWAKKWFMSSK